MSELSTLDDNAGLVWYMQQQRSDRHARKPINMASPVANGSLTVGGLLSCTNGSWSGGAPHMFTYQWYRSGVAIAGAVASSYTTELAGQHYCAVTCKTTGGATQSAPSNTLVIV